MVICPATPRQDFLPLRQLGQVALFALPRSLAAQGQKVTTVLLATLRISPHLPAFTRIYAHTLTFKRDYLHIHPFSHTCKHLRLFTHK